MFHKVFESKWMDVVSIDGGNLVTVLWLSEEFVPALNIQITCLCICAGKKRGYCSLPHCKNTWS